MLSLWSVPALEPAGTALEYAREEQGAEERKMRQQWKRLAEYLAEAPCAAAPAPSPTTLHQRDHSVAPSVLLAVSILLYSQSATPPPLRRR